MLNFITCSFEGGDVEVLGVRRHARPSWVVAPDAKGEPETGVRLPSG